MNVRQTFISGLILISSALAGQSGQESSPGIKQSPMENIVGELYSGVLQSDTYLNPEWAKGDILLETGEVVSNVYLRYNGLTDELFWREPVSERIIKVDKESVRGFHFNDFRGDTTVYFKRMKIKKDFTSDSTLCFLQEIGFINIRLFIYHSKFFLKRETYSVGGITSIRDVYIDEPVYFIESDSRTMNFRKVNRKVLYSAFPEKQALIREYFRKSASGRIRTPREMINFCQYADPSF